MKVRPGPADKQGVRAFLLLAKDIPLALWRVLAVGALLLLSFLPASVKSALHTRGELHYWAHLSVFLGLAILARLTRDGHQPGIAALVALTALAFIIEWVQAHLRWSRIETADIVADLAGLFCGSVVHAARSLPLSAPVGVWRVFLQ